MTIATTNNRVEGTGNGATTTFDVTFVFLSSADLKVYQAGTLKTLTTHYTVSGGNGSTGSVTFLSAPANGDEIVILRDPAITQQTDLRNQGRFFAEVHERVFDKLTMIAQRLDDRLDRAFILSDTDTSGASTVLPSPVASNVIGWNPLGTALENYTPQTFATIVAFGTANSDIFDGDGVTTQFTLSSNPGALNNLDVAIGGVTQTPGIDYTWSGSTALTFTVAPPAGTDNVLVRYMQGLPAGQVADGAIGTAQLIDGAVTLAKLAAQSVNDSKLVPGSAVYNRATYRKSIMDYGAAGDGSTDDTTAVTNALAAGVPLTGDGRTYAITGDITLPDNCDLSDASFKQLSQSSTRRTLKKLTGSGPLKLRRVKVDRNGATSDGGALTDAAAIWIANINDVTLEDIEVTGNGKGAGISLHNCDRVRVARPYVHDMRWSNATDPGTEQILGIWMDGCTQWTISEPNVRNLDGAIGADPVRAYQTDGISIGGSSEFSIIGGSVENCGEGIDVTGSDGNSNFSIVGVHAIDIDAFGFKFANSASNGAVTGCVARDCGYAGFLVSGASQAAIPICEDITFTSCKAIDTGSNGNWSAQSVCGFAVMTGAFTQDWPQGINFVSCDAIDEQTSATMKYGFRSEPAIGPTTVRPNQMINCHSSRHTVARKLGYIVEPESCGYATGRYYGGPNISATTTIALSQDVLYATPIEITEEATFTNIGVYVQTAGAAGKVARLGIYTIKNGVPDALFIDAGTIGIDTTGVREVNMSRTLPRGKYALVLVADGAFTAYGASGNVVTIASLGVGTIGANDTQMSRAFTYAALPATFGAVTYTAANIPNMWVRL